MQTKDLIHPSDFMNQNSKKSVSFKDIQNLPIEFSLEQLCCYFLGELVRIYQRNYHFIYGGFLLMNSYILSVNQFTMQH